MRSLALVLLAACAPPSANAREGFVVDVLAEDNYAWALRDPALVAMKLAKMQRDPFLWLRGTPAVYWRDLTAVGAVRPTTRYGSPASSRVLLLADPHPENIGSFRAPDGTVFVDWNDFDSAGYGPYGGDVRRLAAGLIVAVGDAASGAIDGAAIARAVATGYIAQMRALAAGAPPAAVVTGAAPFLDKLIAKATTNGDALNNLDDNAPVVNGARAFSVGDIDPVAADGVVENRLVALDAVELDRVTRAMASERAHHPELGAITGAVRRIGSGVSSYPALRYYVLLSGPTASPDDDRLVEMKEERDGIAIHGVPQLEAAEWSSPAVRCVDAQRRLHARPDGDDLLDTGELAPLAFKLRETLYQRGVNATDIAALAVDHPDQLLPLVTVFGGMLARSHGAALTADGVPGWMVIAPLLDDGFADEIVAFATADAAQLVADWAALRDRDLAALVIPAVRE